MPHERLRFTATSPDGKKMWKEYSLGLFSREEAHKLGEEWKEWVKSGGYKPEVGDMPITGGREKDIEVNKNVEKKFSLPSKDFTSITLPPEGGASFLFLGSTRSGKTTFINAIYDHYFKKSVGILHTGSPQANIYKELKKQCAMAPGFCEEIIDECMKINMKTDNHYKFTHIIDDCVSSKNNAMMIKLLTIGRNHYQNTLLSGQELSILNAIGRSNINFVFLGKLNSSMAIEKVIKQYLLSHFPTEMKMGDKIKLYSEMTANYNWIVIDAIENDCFLTKLEK
jgi:thymidylate kinase